MFLFIVMTQTLGIPLVTNFFQFSENMHQKLTEKQHCVEKTH